jgi:hypothetical protein
MTELNTTQTADLEALCIDIFLLVAEEKRLSITRTEKQNELAQMVATKLEGTDHAESNHYKVTVSSKLTRKLDYKEYLKIEDELPVKCVNLKPTLDLKKVKMLEELDPEWTSDFITTKPAKAAVKIEIKIPGTVGSENL